jgi:hypothetical protein
VIDKNELCNQVVLTFRIKRSTTLHITLSVPIISIRRQFTIFAKGKPLDFPPKLMPLSAPAPSCLRIWTPRTPWNPGKTKAGNGINTRRGIERRSTSWSTRASERQQERTCHYSAGGSLRCLVSGERWTQRVIERATSHGAASPGPPRRLGRGVGRESQRLVWVSGAGTPGGPHVFISHVVRSHVACLMRNSGPNPMPRH